MPSRAQQSRICKDLTMLACHDNIPQRSEGQPWMLPPPQSDMIYIHTTYKTASCFPTSAMLQTERRNLFQTPTHLRQKKTNQNVQDGIVLIKWLQEKDLSTQNKNFLKTDLIDKRDIQYTLYVEDLTAEYINTDYFLLYEF